MRDDDQSNIHLILKVFLLIVTSGAVACCGSISDLGGTGPKPECGWYALLGVYFSGVPIPVFAEGKI